MFSRIHKRFTYANVAMTLALVFAMSGGAYAAGKYLITSTKQISPKVLKALKGKAGANGANGAAGAQGAQGAQGPQGPGGATGPAGSAGTQGEKGEKGTPGAKGAEGSPWTAKSMLPEGATETGEWAFFNTAAAAKEFLTTAISFPIQLANAPKLNIVHVGELGSGECEGGTVADPKAKLGNLCLFEGESAVYKGGLRFASSFDASGSLGPGKTGVEILFETLKTGEVSAEGTWAVTG